MARLIQTSDGILIEVEAEPGQYELSSARSADRVEKTIQQIGPLLRSMCGAVKEMWGEQAKDLGVEQVQVEFSLSFETEGSAYIARAKAGASVAVTVTLKRPE